MGRLGTFNKFFPTLILKAYFSWFHFYMYLCYLAVSVLGGIRGKGVSGVRGY